MATPVDIGVCIKCREPMWLSQESYQTLERSGAAFHCPFGHTQVFRAGKTDEDKLREQLDEERRQRQRAEQRIAMKDDQIKEALDQAEHERRRANGYKGHAAKITKRAKAGVCPCCNRTFAQLARHMSTQHPTFTPEVADPPFKVIEGGKVVA